MCLQVPPPPTSLVAMANASETSLVTAAGADLESSGRVFQRLLKERIVFIGSAIDQVTANLVCAQLVLLEAEDPDKDISLYINSPGGSVTDGLAIYDTMQYVQPDVSTICVGLAASMGQFLLCAGAPGKRYALPHSRILMHQPSGSMQGQAADIAIQAEQIIYLKRMMAERIAFHTGQPLERIETDSDRDRWFTAEEACEYGFIDKVIDRSTAHGHGGGGEQIDVAVDVPASSSDADRRLERVTEVRVADRSAEAAEAAGVSRSAAQRGSVTRVVTPTISVRKRLREIWLSRELLIYLVRTEIKVKYKNSVLGLVWSMVSPAMTLAIYFFVFSIVLDNKMPNFVIYLFAGLLVWNLFSLGVLTGTGVVVSNAGIVKKVSFPREILALAAVGSACVFFFFQSIVMVIFMVILRAPPDVAYFPLLILALIAGVILASALAVLLSSINVYLRDTQHLIEVILTAWFWACPIVYSYQTVEAKLGPRHLTWIYLANPMTPLVLAFQRCLYNKPSAVINGVLTLILPQHGYLWYTALVGIVLVIGLVLFVVALATFGRLEGNFAEEL